MKNLSKKLLVIFTVFIFLIINIVSCNQKTAIREKEIILATTTSTYDSGLLDELIPVFEKKYKISVKPIAVGTGEALRMGERGEVDIVLVHSRSAEDKFLEEGYGVNRKDVMHNDFVIIGPEEDPAEIKGNENVTEAFKKISEKQMLFLSRGDDSGTHKKEIKIWEEAGIEPKGDWYLEAGQGMAGTIMIANEKNAYTLSDRGTYLSLQKNIQLKILFEGDPLLLNPYGIIAVNPDKHSKVNYEGAMRFIEFITSKDGQEIIKNFGIEKYGQPLFFPDVIR
ncbi:MAG: substrate-binding domain-containing protein [Actinobacteria bacterium]|nr:substrate-binding domain-containing protein [Actinomycetota bacterium]